MNKGTTGFKSRTGLYSVCCIADPNSVELNIDGTTDKCSKGEDINFIFTGFTLSGKVGFKAYHTCTCVHVHKKFNRILTISLYNVCIKLNSRKVNIAALLYVQTCIISKD